MPLAAVSWPAGGKLLVDSVLEALASLESRITGSSDLDRRTRLRVTPLTSSALPLLEGPKPSDLDATSSSQLTRDDATTFGGEQRGERFLGVFLGETRLMGQGVTQLSFVHANFNLQVKIFVSGERRYNATLRFCGRGVNSRPPSNHAAEPLWEV